MPQPVTETKFTQAYQRLKAMIVTLELPPGSILDEDTLQRQLGIGSTPLRQALHRLSLERMVDIFPRRAMMVGQLGISDARQIVEAREALETVAAQLAAQRITADEAATLTALGTELRSSHAAQDVARWRTAHEELHCVIARCSRNTYLAEDIDHLMTLGIWMYNMFLDPDHLPRLDAASHDDIIEAITAGDAPAAGVAMGAHFHYLKLDLLSLE